MSDPRTNALLQVLEKVKGLPDTIGGPQPVTLSRNNLTTMLGALVEISTVLNDWEDDGDPDIIDGEFELEVSDGVPSAEEAQVD